MNHVSVDGVQSVSNEYGELITCGGVRFRKSLVVAYWPYLHPELQKWTVLISMANMNHALVAVAEDQEHAERECQRLDAILNKDYVRAGALNAVKD